MDLILKVVNGRQIRVNDADQNRGGNRGGHNGRGGRFIFNVY